MPAEYPFNIDITCRGRQDETLISWSAAKFAAAQAARISEDDSPRAFSRSHRRGEVSLRRMSF